MTKNFRIYLLLCIIIYAYFSMENIEQIKDKLSDYNYKFLTNLQRYIDTELIFLVA